MNAYLRFGIAAVLLALAAPSFAQPLDIYNGATRTVLVQFENSIDPTLVGQSFGTAIEATYSASGNIGTLTISPEAHKQLYLDAYGPGYYGSASALVFEFDLSTLEVTSRQATAHLSIMRGAGLIYTTVVIQHTLGTSAPGGVISGAHTTQFCTDQSTVDQLCSQDSDYCGETCTAIAGLPYDRDTGLVNLIGSQSEQTCDRCCCGPVLYDFALLGDMLVSEVVVPMPVLPNRPLAVIPVTLIVAVAAGMVLFRMRSATKYLPSMILAASLTASAMSSAQEPLDLSDPTLRTVWVHFEESSNATVVGQTFGPPFPATYWVEGNTGKLFVDATWHRQLRGLGPNAGSVSPLQYEFDLTTLEATSQQAVTSYSFGANSTIITQYALGTTLSGGVISPDLEAFFCPDQAYIDQQCNDFNYLCGQTCTLIPGSPYDPNTGLVNLVGSETNTICTFPVGCGTDEMYSHFGDLMLTEIAAMPGLPNRPVAVIPVVLIMALVAGVVLFRFRAAPR